MTILLWHTWLASITSFVTTIVIFLTRWTWFTLRTWCRLMTILLWYTWLASITGFVTTIVIILARFAWRTWLACIACLIVVILTSRALLTDGACFTNRCYRLRCYLNNGGCARLQFAFNFVSCGMLTTKQIRKPCKKAFLIVSFNRFGLFFFACNDRRSRRTTRSRCLRFVLNHFDGRFLTADWCFFFTAVQVVVFWMRSEVFNFLEGGRCLMIVVHVFITQTRHLIMRCI